MKNPFSPDAFNVQELKRIPRDLSCRKLFTTEFGKGVPILAQEVFPGDTFKIQDVGIDIQGMPTYFPLTSRLKVSVSFFLCRNRCVDDSWEDFIFNTKEIDKAWIRMDNTRAKKMISTGSLGDFFGVPSTVGSSTSFTDHSFFKLSDILFFNNSRNGVNIDFDQFVASYFSTGNNINSYLVQKFLSSFRDNRDTSAALLFDRRNLSEIPVVGSRFTIPIVNGPVEVLPVSLNDFTYIVFTKADGEIIFCEKLPLTLSEDGTFLYSDSLFSSSVCSKLSSVESYSMCIVFSHLIDDTNVYGFSNSFISGSLAAFPESDLSSRVPYPSWICSCLVQVSATVDATDDSVIADNIYVGANPVRKLEAHVFRHYTMIGNYYYRNDRNNPYVLNGEVQYNQFIPTKSSGPDDNVYDFFYRNWELDRFTSCCQTPQFGDAPLVGLTYNPSLDSTELTFSATDPEGVIKSYKVTVGLDSDQKLASIANFDKDIPSTILQNVTKMITYGTSINDIRVTNSFQRFLERAQRGLRYRHQMKSHLGVSVDYPDIDIPQYIGGFNGEINSFRNDNTTASEYANLGDFNGSLFGNFSLPNPITVQVPEHGYIMGIMTIVPVPMYPQSVTNKALIKRSPFEYPLQEFMKVGNVPIHYDEVMPLQNGTGQSPDDVFGYNRPWYEYLSNLDEVHGDFRTTLTQFNCVRMFAQRPELSADFTTVHPEELNQIFITNNIADKYGSNAKFLCRADFKMTALRQIPDGDPALE